MVYPSLPLHVPLEDRRSKSGTDHTQRIYAAEYSDRGAARPLTHSSMKGTSTLRWMTLTLISPCELEVL